jgi:arylsulfatase
MALIRAAQLRTLPQVLFVLAMLLPLSCQEANDPAPNVLLVSVDTLRADHLGSYGSTLGASPRLDALAAQGVVFERAIAAASRTVPAHTSIMTSRHTREHSVGHLNGETRLRGRATLAEHFREAGYATAGFVSNILLTRRTGLDAGFDVFDDELTTPELNRPHVVERLAEDTTARAIRWLKAKRTAPLFLWVHYQDPHGPYTPPEAIHVRFDMPHDAAEPALPIGRSNQSRGVIPPYQVLPGLEYASEYRARYAGEIFHADASIGELVDAFTKASSPRPRIVLVTADHGESLGENDHYFVHTTATTPDVAHVPLLLLASGLEPGRQNELVGHVDVMPTLLELADLEVPQSARGVALGPLARGESSLPERYLYCDIGSQLSAYGDDGFLQVGGLADVWRAGAAPPSSPPWRRFEWQPGAPWRLIERGKGGLPPAILRYASRAEPLALLPPPDPALIENLKALGYADD